MDILPIATESAQTTFVYTTTGFERILVYESLVINGLLILYAIISIVLKLVKNGIAKKNTAD